MSQYLDEIDLTTPQGVVVYVAPTPFACAKAEPLSGGSANFIFRLHLITPYQGRSTLILKHATPYAARIPEFSIPVSRQVGQRFKATGSSPPFDLQPNHSRVGSPTIPGFRSGRPASRTRPFPARRARHRPNGAPL